MNGALTMSVSERFFSRTTPRPASSRAMPAIAFRLTIVERWICGEPLVSKSVNAAFIGTDLDLRLRRLGVRHVVLFGISTDMCVSTTARVAANLGYRVTVVGDACACFELPDGNGGTIDADAIHRAHLATLRAEFAEVVDTDAVLAALAA